MPVAIVFGAAHGLGKACRTRVDSEFKTVVVADLEDVGGEHALRCDASRREDVEAVFLYAERLGPVNAVITTVGNFPRAPLLNIELADWDFSFKGNVLSVYEVYRAAALSRSRKPDPEPLRVCGTSSVNSFQAHPGNAHYAAMKAAVNSLTKSFAVDQAKQGVFYNAVAPGGIKHERTANLPWMADFEARHPLGRAASPDEIAEIAYFLVSRKNGYMTGEILTPTGGAFFRS